MNRMKIICKVILLMNALETMHSVNGSTLEQISSASLIVLDSSLFDCVDHDEFCSSNSSEISFPGVVLTEEKLTVNFTILQPQTGPRCWDNSIYNCCYDPCHESEPNPCLNNGKCRNSNQPNESFTCDCKGTGYDGEWCEVNDKCSLCDENADCDKEKGTCSCKEGYSGKDGKDCTAFCGKFTVTPQDLPKECSGFDDITFNQTFEYYKQDSNQKCTDGGKDGRSVATIDCPANGQKFNLNTLRCLPCNYTIHSLPPVENITSPKEVAKVLENLSLLTSKTSEPPEEVEEATNMLEKLAVSLHEKASGGEEIQISENSMKDVMQVVENLGIDLLQSEEENKPDPFSQTATSSEANEKRRKATRKAAKILDDFARSVNLSATENKTVEITTSKMSLKITEPEKKKDKTFDEVIFEPEAYVPQKLTDSVPIKRKTIKMTIPPGALAEMQRQAMSASGVSMRLVFVLHQDASLLTVDKRTGQVVQATFKRGESNEVTPLNQESIKIEHAKPQTATPAQNAKVEGTNYKVFLKFFCVFWDFKHEKWATEGCKFYRATASASAYCECNHLTSFALLLRVTKVLKNYKPNNMYNIVACSLSAFCLFATALIYLLVKDLRVRRPTPILVNICVNLAIGFLTFVIGMDGRYRKFSDIQCYLSAIVMHVAFLCSWFWMLIYSLNMYYALVKVVGTSPLVAKKAFMYLVGYGVPIIIVVTDLVVSTELDKAPSKIEDEEFESHYIASHVCWVRSMSMYLGFAMPVAIALFINLVLFFLIIRKLTWKRIEIRSSKEAASTSQQIFMAITMITMMGLTWVFGYIMLITDDPHYQQVMSIIFDVFNTCQGVVIFLVCCVRQKTVRDLWFQPIRKRFCCKRSVTHKNFSSDFSVSTGSTNTIKNTGNSTTAL